MLGNYCSRFRNAVVQHIMRIIQVSFFGEMFREQALHNLLGFSVLGLRLRPGIEKVFSFSFFFGFRCSRCQEHD